MIHYKSIDQSQFAKGTDIASQEAQFEQFARETMEEIAGKKAVLSPLSPLPSPLSKTVLSPLSSLPSPLPYILLKTCNRTELYYGEGDVSDDVARHLFRVVAGLESAIIGERAVQGQVKEAYYTAKAQRWLPAEMHKLFLAALTVGKRVRNETEISHGAVSHSLATLELLHDEHIDLRHARITIIGVNKLTEDILKFLQNKGVEMVFLANRSQIKAHHLADPLGIKVFTLDEKRDFIAQSDILISATSAPHLIIGLDDVPRDKQLLAIDLAFPHDIDSRLSALPHVSLYNIRDVEERVRQNIAVRASEVEKAENIIEEEIKALQEALNRRKRYLKQA